MSVFVGNAPCSWGTLEFASSAERIPYPRMLDELAETGYEGTELGKWGFLPTTPLRLQEELKKRDLDLTGAFIDVAFADETAHAKGLQRALRTARLVAAAAKINTRGHLPFIVLADRNGTDPLRTRHAGRITPDLGLDKARWRVFSRAVERFSRAIRDETGLSTVFHPHCAGFVETPEEIERLLATTSPELVGLVFDTGHITYGSGHNDPARVGEVLEAWSKRVWYLHFKDCDPEVARRARTGGWDYFQALRAGVFCQLGQGLVDFPAVVRWVRRRGYRGWITVEQDVLPGMGSPKVSAQRNRDFLKTLGL